MDGSALPLTHSGPSAPAACGPLVSVIIPAYNAAAWIGRTLAAVHQQTYAHLEVVVVDDGSSDATAQIVQGWMPAFTAADDRPISSWIDAARTVVAGGPQGLDHRSLILLCQTNSGVAVARNTGIAAAAGTLIAPLDADDLWAPSYLEKLVQRFQNSPPTVGVVYAWSVDIDEQDGPIGGFQAARIEGWVYPTLLCHNFLGNASATLVRRAVLDQVGGYAAGLRQQQAQGCEDWDLYLRLARVCEFRAVPEFLVQYRQQTQSMSRQFDAMTHSQRLVLAAQSPPPPSWLLAMAQSSFDLLIARRCYAQGDWAGARHWLQAAHRVDPLSCWLRPGSLVMRWQSARNQARQQPPPIAAPHHWPDRGAVQRRLWASSGLHWVLQRLFRSDSP
jgi:glycosyltransferase involved in cell wall biosynthesis